ncbi:MAG: RHS repeat-associated core domain-containing protein [Planctomycetota bacterium]
MNSLKRSMRLLVPATACFLALVSEDAFAQVNPQLVANGQYVTAQEAETNAGNDPTYHCFPRVPCSKCDGGEEVSGDGNRVVSDRGVVGAFGGSATNPVMAFGGGSSFVTAKGGCITCSGSQSQSIFEAAADSGDKVCAPCSCGDFRSGDAWSYVENGVYSYNHIATDCSRVINSPMSLRRFHRSRDFTDAGGFGQGVANSFDYRLRLEKNGANTWAAPNWDYWHPDNPLGSWDGNTTAIWMSVPDEPAPMNFDFLSGNTLVPQQRWRGEKLEMLDGSMNPVNASGSPAKFPGAQYAKLHRNDGSTLLFELIVVDEPFGWDPLQHHPSDGRLVEMENPEGGSYSITYKAWTAAEITASPSRQWQIDTVTDNLGNTLTFDYKTTQENGNWVIEDVTLPDSSQVLYRYAGGMLSEIEYSDGAISSFDYSSSLGGLFKMSVEDFGAQPGSRRKTVILSGTVGTINGTVVPTSVGLCRVVINGEDEVTYATFKEGQVSGYGTGYETIVYEGQGVLYAGVNFQTLGGSAGGLAPKRYFEDWTLTFGPNTVTRTGDLEDSTELFQGLFNSVIDGRPGFTIAANGTRVDHSYDSVGDRIFSVYADNTFEAWCYNSLHQITRHRDRMGHVTKYTYNSSGQMLTKEVGLTDDPSNTATPPPYSSGPSAYDRCATNDVQTAEYAKTEWQYHTSGNGTGRLAKEIDPLGNATDYEYDTDHRLTKVKLPADTSGGTRPVWERVYDSSDRLSKVIDPMGHEVQFFYDSRQRLISTLYDDGTTERLVYHTTGPERGLLAKSINRIGVVTTYDYDDADRLIQVVEAAAQMDGTTETATPEIALTKAVTYLNGRQEVLTSSVAGAKSSYVYDFRARQIQSEQEPVAGKSLKTTLTYEDNQLFAVEDPYGRKTYYGYDATNGRRIRTVMGAVPEYSVADFAEVFLEVRDLTPNADFVLTDTIYNDDGTVQRSINPRDIPTDYIYDSRGRRTTVTQAVATIDAKTETLYDLNDNVTELRSPRYFDVSDSEGYLKAKETWTFTDRGLVATHTEAPGTSEAATESFEYDLAGRRIKHTDFRGKVWKSHYSECCGQVTASENPLGDGTIVRRDSAGRTAHSAAIGDYASHTSSLENPVDAKTYREVTTKYDGRGRPIAQTTWLSARGVVDSSDPPIAGLGGVAATEGLTEQYLYDENLNDNSGLDSTIGATPPIGSAVSLNAALTKLSQTVVNGGAGVSFDTDSPGSARVAINAEGEVRFSISDASGRIIMSGMVNRSDNSLITWSCRALDTTSIVAGYGTVLVAEQVNAMGKSRKSLSDALGRRIQGADELGEIVSLTYDAASNQLSVRDPNGAGQDCVYDNLGRNVQCTDTVGDVTSSSYDKASNRIAATDAKSNAATYTFDARGRLIKKVDRRGGETRFTYLRTGELERLADSDAVDDQPSGPEATVYSYDAAGRKLTETHPNTTTPVSYARDPIGRVTRKTDQLGDTVSYSYDLAGRLASRDYRTAANSPGGTIADTDLFTYDSAGRMLTAVSGRYLNTVVFTYDSAGRISTESLVSNGVTYTTTTGYDDVGRVSKLTYPDGTVIDRLYTDRGLLSGVKYNSTTIDTRTYDDGGRMLTSTYNNGVSETRAYNSDNTLVSIVFAGAAIGNLSYGWDANKNKTRETITGTMSGYGFDVGTMGHNDDDQLVNWERDDTNLDQSWGLTPVGDWNSFIENGAVTTRSHNPAHEITSGGFQHDVKGNMTLIPASLHAGIDPLSLSWDFDNRLSSADVDNDGTADVTYRFDAHGRRVGRDDGNTNEVYVQAGQTTVADYTVGAAAVNPLYTYAYGTYIDEPIMRGGTGGLTYYHRNQQYSIIALTDGSGGLKERYAYTAYGTQLIFNESGVSRSSTAEGNRYSYTGREWDDALHLYFFRARMYSPSLGRFCSRDPGGFVDGPSLYDAYFGMSDLDPFGLWKWHWHHELPVEFEDEFIEAGLDIDAPEYGHMLPQPYHTGPDGVHPRGYNADWYEFFAHHPNATKEEILAFLEDMRSDYEDLYKHGRPATKRYTYEYFRKNGKEWRKLLGKSGAVITAFGYLIAGGKWANACSGKSCEPELRKVDQFLRRFRHQPRRSNCQDLASSIRVALACAGFEDIPNNIPNYMALRNLFAECSKLP